MEEMTLQKEATKTAAMQKTNFIVRDIFHLKFGHFKDAKKLLEEAKGMNMLPQVTSFHLYSDFTGDAYRLILEGGFNSLAEYENYLKNSMGQKEWQEWYEKFKLHVERGQREILKQLA